MKKRIISIMVILTVLLSSSYSFAETTTSTNENDYVPSYEELIQDKDVIILNEVDIIQDLQKQTDQTLKQDGFNEEEIKKIRNYNPQKYIKQLSKLSRIELENKKFSTQEHTEKAINSVETRVTYGHTAISVSPSVSWNGISVTFKKSMMNMGHKNLTLK